MKKSTKQNYWFKRRRYGYGWIPVTWQGWAVILGFLAIVVGGTSFLSANPYSNESVWMYLNVVTVAIIVLFIVCLQKGPKPKWRWGSKSGDNKKEDF